MFNTEDITWHADEHIIGSPMAMPVAGDRELSTLEVDGSGNIEIRNTGGSSASEGGMGDSGGAEKGPGILQPDGKPQSGETGNESFDKKFDPLAPKEDKDSEKS